MKWKFLSKTEFTTRKIVIYAALNVVLVLVLFLDSIPYFNQFLSTAGRWCFITIASLVICASLYLILEFAISIPDSKADFVRITGSSILVIFAIILAYANMYHQLYRIFKTAAFSGETLTAGDFIFFSITTFTTTGYGDISPINPVANGATASEMLFGFFSNSIFMAILVWKLAERRKN